MKHKVLLTGNNETVINEFFTYMDLVFECISTSQRYDDIMNHLKYVRPDVFVYCLFNENFDDLKRFANVARKISDERIPIVIIGNPSDCNELVKMAPAMEAAILKKPYLPRIFRRLSVKFLPKSVKPRKIQNRL